MKKSRRLEKLGFDIATLRRWKKTTVKERLIWLDSALKFGKAKKRQV